VAGTLRRTLLCIVLSFLNYAVAAHNVANAADVILSPDEQLALVASSQPDPCARYRARNWLRQRVVREIDLERYGIALDADWQRAPAHRPVVILVHGFNSGREQNIELIRPIRDQHIGCGTFAYPNDHTIAASAKLLSCELRAFAVRYPERRIALVCHSMGSLVARACIEDPRLDPANVDRLIMIAPPTHGTLMAYFAVGTDVYEHWLSRRSGGPWRRMRDSVVDGLGEAADDLRPESEFLHVLNSQPLNARVRYTNLLGTGASLDDEQVTWIRESFCHNLARVPGADGSAERLREILNDIDEIVEGKGDGIVAVKRGRLDGVADTVVLPFGHMAVTGEPDDETLQKVQQVVLARIQM
jgi:pimeloyl-ACP methyl ester carboxylesterase